MAASACAKRKWQVLMLWPNVICYVRFLISMVAVGLAVSDAAATWIVASMYLFGMALDALDGAVARALGQQSEVGAVLDVLVDVVCRGSMWALSINGPLVICPVVLELVCFACTHAGGGQCWKTDCFAGAPSYVTAVMRNGFRSPVGAVTMAGLHFLPLWLWLSFRLPAKTAITRCAVGLIGAILIVGRMLAGAVEVWVIARYFNAILVRDAVALTDRCDSSNKR